MIQQASIGLICQHILTRPCLAPSIEVAIRETQRIVGYFFQQMRVIFDRIIHALDVHVFSLCCRNLKVHSTEWSELGNDLEEKRQNPRSESRFAVNRSPLTLIASAVQVIEKFLPAEIWIFLHQLIVTRKQCDARHLRDKFADATTIAADGQIHVSEYILKLQVIGFIETALQQRP